MAILFGMPMQISMLYGHGAGELGAIFNKLTLFNYMVMTIAALNIYFCINASEQLRWSLPLSAAIICINNSVVMIYGNDFESANVIISTLIYFSFVAYFYATGETKIIEMPEKHWWRIPTRVELREKVLISKENLDINFGETFDISSGGAFIAHDTQTSQIVLKTGDVIDLVIGEKDQIHVKAKIVRKASAKGHYPSGIGLQFIDMSVLDKIKLTHKLYATQNSLAA